MSQESGGFRLSHPPGSQALCSTYRIFVTALVAAMLLGCSAVSNREEQNFAQDHRTRPAPGLPAFPPPSALKLGSYTEAGLQHVGADYTPELPHANISVVDPDLQFEPHWENNQSPADSLAYAGYGFDLSGYDRDFTLRLEWAVAPPAGSSWIGLADFSRDRWDWRQPGAENTVTADFATLLDGQATLVAIVLVTGMQQCRLAGIRVGAPPAAPWPMYGCDNRHSRCSPASGPASTPHLAWSFRTTGPGFLYSEPAFGADGTIYLGSSRYVPPLGDNPEVTALNADGTLKWRSARIVPTTPVTLGTDGTLYVGCWNWFYALDAAGNVLWRYDTEDTIQSPATVTADGEILCGSMNNILYCIKPDGTLQWSFAGASNIIGIYGRPALAADGTIYFGSSDGLLYAVNPDGSLKWSYNALASIWSAPLVGPDGAIYFGANGARLMALNPDGTLRWEYDAAPDTYVMSPALGPDGSLSVSSIHSYDDRSGALHALNPDGTLQWQAPFDWITWNSPAVSSDGTVYVGDGFGTLSAFDAAGQLLWTYGETDTVQSSVVSIPRFGPDGTIYISCYNGTFHAITPAGALKWKYTGGGWIDAEPVVDAQGTAYFTCMDRNAYAVNADGSLKWSFALPEYSRNPPALAADGTVYLTCQNGSLYAVDPAGALAWEYQSGSSELYTLFTPPVIAADGAVSTTYLDNGAYNVATLNPDGSLRWKYLGANHQPYTMLLHPNGNRLCGTSYSLAALTALGALDWEQAFEVGAGFALLAAAPGGTIFSRAQEMIQTFGADGAPGWSSSVADFSGVSAIAVNSQDKAYIGCNDTGAGGALVALNPDGTANWIASGGSFSAPALDCNGMVYSIESAYAAPFDLQAYVTATDAGGARQWELELPAIFARQGVYTAPIIGESHMLFVGASDGRLYAISD